MGDFLKHINSWVFVFLLLYSENIEQRPHTNSVNIKTFRATTKENETMLTANIFN